MNAITEATNLELKEGEKLAFSITLPDGETIHTILLPGEKCMNWNDGMAWAKEQGGDLPDLVEHAFFKKYMPEEFKPKLYWSNTQHAGGSDYAWCQGFSDGSQYYYYKRDALLVRAVRRVTTIHPI